MSDYPAVETLPLSAQAALGLIEKTLDQDKAEDIVSIPLNGKSDVADYMVIATGRSVRHVHSLANNLQYALKQQGADSTIEGLQDSDWVLVDAGDVIVHLFPEEVRGFYNLEKLWSFEPKGRKAKATS
jgi:ribosome-associated protein